MTTNKNQVLSDEEIAEVVNPIESRMYAIQIQHVEWLRENNAHLVMVGEGHDTVKAIRKLEALILQRERERLRAWVEKNKISRFSMSAISVSDIFEQLKDGE